LICIKIWESGRIKAGQQPIKTKQNKTITTIFYVWLDNCLQTKSNADSSTVLDTFDSYLPDTVEVRPPSAPKSCPDQFKGQELADFWLIFCVLLNVFSGGRPRRRPKSKQNTFLPFRTTFLPSRTTFLHA
jgi:hypothetical protein